MFPIKNENAQLFCYGVILFRLMASQKSQGSRFKLAVRPVFAGADHVAGLDGDVEIELVQNGDWSAVVCRPIRGARPSLGHCRQSGQLGNWVKSDTIARFAPIEQQYCSELTGFHI
jgi:hypothetical protein